MARDITESMSVGRVATAYPELIPELERLGLDYCCAGGRTLADAAERIGEEPSAIVARLSGYVPERGVDARVVNYAGMSMTNLADHIERTRHVFARDALERLERLLAKCVAAHADDEPRLVDLQRTFSELCEDMRDHFVREERVVFPWLRRLERTTEITSGPPWSVRRPIDCMIHDHDDVGEAFDRIHALTDDLTPPDDACSTWRECYRLLGELETDTHMHIHKENNILFPAGIEAEERRGGGPARRRPSTTFLHGGFTLVELLVVVAVIALLVGISLPAIGKARSSGRSIACLSQNRSIAVAMTVYANEDADNFFPTARMPGMAMGGNPAAPIQMSWLYLLAPYLGVEPTLPDDPTTEAVQEFVESMQVCRCPADHSQNWSSMMMPRLTSYGINAYLTPNHPPHWGVKPFQIRSPSECVLCAELAEEMAMDHFMPMYWGEPPAVENAMIQSRQWDAATQLPRTIQHSRHAGERANYVFADGHAAAHTFDLTWQQRAGEPPSVDWYDPRR